MEPSRRQTGTYAKTAHASAPLAAVGKEGGTGLDSTTSGLANWVLFMKTEKKTSMLVKLFSLGDREARVRTGFTVSGSRSLLELRWSHPTDTW